MIPSLDPVRQATQSGTTMAFSIWSFLFCFITMLELWNPLNGLMENVFSYQTLFWEIFWFFFFFFGTQLGGNRTDRFLPGLLARQEASPGPGSSQWASTVDADTSYIVSSAGQKKKKSLASAWTTATTTSRQRRLWPCWEIKGETRRPDGVSLLCVGPISRERDGRRNKRRERVLLAARWTHRIVCLSLSLYTSTIVGWMADRAGWPSALFVDKTWQLGSLRWGNK